MFRMWIQKRGATRTYRKKRGAKAAIHLPIGWFTMLLGIILGILLTILIFNQFSFQSQKTVKKSEHIVSKKTKKLKLRTPSAKTAHKDKKTRFEFYQLLPKQKFDVTKQSTQTKSTTKKAKLKRPSTKKKTLALNTPNPLPLAKPTTYQRFNYQIQIASFTKKQEADELRAKLALSGFPSKINHVKLSKGKSRFRVLVGPYASQKLATKYQKQLESYRIRNTLIVKQRK